MRVDQFDFDLPSGRVALHPAVPRDSARMLVVDPSSSNAGLLRDQSVVDLVDILSPNDILVANNTKVLPAELTGIRKRADAVAKITVNLHKRDAADLWRAFVRPAKKLRVNEHIWFSGGPGHEPLRACCENKGQNGEVLLRFEVSGADLDEAIKALGTMPLPPYVSARRKAGRQDKVDYQTIYAKHDGAVAAPTAGLHFTAALLQRIAQKGVALDFVTLHVGAGTFLPVSVDDTDDHRMHAEWGELTAQTVLNITRAQERGGRVFAVGTTSLRVLEAASRGGKLTPFCGETDIFITPGHRFCAVDALMTNFHLPRSTLFMLVSAFSGLETMHKAYAHAIANDYRFYSYGDASLLFRKEQ